MVKEVGLAGLLVNEWVLVVEVVKEDGLARLARSPEVHRPGQALPNLHTALPVVGFWERRVEERELTEEVLVRLAEEYRVVPHSCLAAMGSPSSQMS